MPGRCCKGPFRNRRGALTIEFIIVLPILFMVTVAIVQFGLLFGQLQQVSLAARVGAATAAESAQLAGTSDGDPVPLPIRDAVTRQLSSSNIDWCRIRLEHNVDGMTVVLASEQNGGCSCGTETSLSGPPYLAEKYVRLTVFVPLTELAPNALYIVGIPITEKVTGATSVRHVEP